MSYEVTVEGNGERVVHSCGDLTYARATIYTALNRTSANQNAYSAASEMVDGSHLETADLRIWLEEVNE